MKKQSFQMKQWAKVCLALSLGLPLTACVDDSYDASKDIDMTMGLGSQGLQLKLGNTENIMLADLLEEDENLKTDAQHTYYLIESGRTNVNFSVDRMNAYIDNAVLSPSLEVLNYSKLQELIPATAGSLNVPEGFVYQINNLTADNNMNFKFDNISSVVKQVKSITPAAGTKLKISMALEQNGMYFAIRDIDNLKSSYRNTCRWPIQPMPPSPDRSFRSIRVTMSTQRKSTSLRWTSPRLSLTATTAKSTAERSAFRKPKFRSLAISRSPLHAPSLRPQAANSRSTFISTWVTPSSDKTKWSSTM